MKIKTGKNRIKTAFGKRQIHKIMNDKGFASMVAKGRSRVAMQHCANFAKRRQMRQKATIMRPKIKTQIKITPHQINPIGKA